MSDTSNQEKGKRLYIVTYGCQMNVRDSEVICGVLIKNGYEIIDNPEAADVVLFNTCSVRQHAEDKVWSEVGRIAQLEKRKTKVTVTKSDSHLWHGNGGDSRLLSKPIIGIIGCMAQNYKDDIFKRAPAVDFVVGPADIGKIPEIIAKVARHKAQDTGEEKVKKVTVTKRRDSHLFVKSQSHKGTSKSLFETKIWETEGETRPEEIYHTGFYEDKEHAFVVISEGCSNFCSYCVVPFVRGGLRHRNFEDIIKEIEEAVHSGTTKITLLGQNVNAYRGEGKFGGEVDFIRLLEMVNALKGLKEFSFITSHPKDTSVDLFKAMQELDKLKKYLHLPAQSGSDRILKAMNRGYARKYYLELARNYRKIVEGGVLTTDIIVGFPTETEEDFQDTYNLVKDVGFNSAYIFKYSARPHTAAANMPDDVSKEEKERRHKIILDLQKEISKNNKRVV
jgi:tRNA-2-methylthio-N6-dimethylallyladenosine synthase